MGQARRRRDRKSEKNSLKSGPKQARKKVIDLNRSNMSVALAKTMKPISREYIYAVGAVELSRSHQRTCPRVSEKKSIYSKSPLYKSDAD